MDEKEQEAVLNNFSRINFVAEQIPYNTGRSGAIVFAGQFRPKDSSGPGFTQTYIVKIGKRSWAEREKAFFESDSAQPLRHLIAWLSDTSLPLSPQNQAMAAMAYNVAGDTLLYTAPLSEVFKSQSALGEEQAIQQIETLTRELVNWHIKAENMFNSPTCAPHELLHKMLGDARVRTIHARLSEELPEWDQDILSLYFNQLLIWNPLPHLKEDAWSWTKYRPTFPTGRIHGDLHTGNIICSKRARENTLPSIIDFGQTAGDGVPFFDFAYLEFDILQNIFHADDPFYGAQWRELLNHTMSAILPQQQLNTSHNAVRVAWKFIKPIREQVNRLLDAVHQQNPLMKEYYEIAWWFTIVAVGLNYARKGDQEQHRPPQERQAALFYASFGLKQLHEILPGAENSLQQDSSITVPWKSTQNSDAPTPQTLSVMPDASSMTEEAQLQHYLQSLRDTVSDKVDLSMFPDSASSMLGIHEVLVTDVFVWAQVTSDRPPYDTLPRPKHLTFHGEPNLVEGSWQEQQYSDFSPKAQKLSEVLGKDSHLVILGDAGSGKTMFLCNLLLQIINQNADFARDFPQLANLLPVYIDFTEYTNVSEFDYPSFAVFLTEHFDRHYPRCGYASLLLSKAKSGKKSNVLFLFDGLDAIHDDGKRSKIVQLIQSFSLAPSSYANNYYIVTSRIIGYTQETKINKYSTYTLLHFTSDEIKLFVENWCAAYQRLGFETAEASPLLQRLRRDRSIQELATHPLLLAIYVIMYLQENGHRFQRILYFQQCINAFIHHWLIARNPMLSPVVVDALRKELCTLAFWMHNRPFTKYLTHDELVEQVKQQISQHSPNDSLENLAEFYLELARKQADILVESYERCYSFLFYPFQEYLAAEALLDRANNNDFIKEHLRSPHWREVLRLAVSIFIARERKNKNKIENLIETIYHVDQSDPLRPYNLLFVGQCLVDNTEGDYHDLEDKIIGEIVQEYLGPSDWLRSTFSQVLRDWNNTQDASEARKTLVQVLGNSASSLNGTTWDKKVAYTYQVLASNNKPTEKEIRRLHIMTLLYHLNEKDNIATWIKEAIEDLSPLTDPEVRANAATALGILGQEHPQQVKSVLLEAFSDSKWQVRAAAGKALGSLTNIDPSILDDLNAILSDESASIQKKETTIMTLGQVSRVATKALNIILSYLLNIFDPGNTLSLNGDGAINLPEQTQGTVPYNVLSTPVVYDPSLKRSFVLTVGQIARKQPEDIPSRTQVPDLLLKAITDEDASVRQAAAVALGCLGKQYWIGEQPRIIKALLIAHADVYFPVIETAIKALEYLGDYPLPVEHLRS